MQQLAVNAHLQLLMLLMLLMLLVQLCSEGAEAARYSRYSRSRSRSLYRRHAASTVRALVRNKFSYSVKRTAFTRGIFTSSYRWRVRHGTDSNLDDVTLCFNVYDALPAELNTSDSVPWRYQNSTVYGVFACPIGDDDSKVYCCGSTNHEFCCGFWEDAGRIAGLIMGILAGICAIGYLIHLAKKKGLIDCSLSCLQRSRPVTPEPNAASSGSAVSVSRTGSITLPRVSSAPDLSSSGAHWGSRAGTPPPELYGPPPPFEQCSEPPPSYADAVKMSNV